MKKRVLLVGAYERDNLEVEPAGERLRWRPETLAGLDLDVTSSLGASPREAAGGGPLPAGDFEVRANVSVASFSHARSVRRNGAPLVLTSSPPNLAVRRDVLLRPPMARRMAARFKGLTVRPRPA